MKKLLLILFTISSITFSQTTIKVKAVYTDTLRSNSNASIVFKNNGYSAFTPQLTQTDTFALRKDTAWTASKSYSNARFSLIGHTQLKILLTFSLVAVFCFCLAYAMDKIHGYISKGTTMKSWDAAINLTSAIQGEHSKACHDNPMLALILFDLIGDARKILQRLDEIKTIQKQTEQKEKP
jgi:hypothetical protein